MAIPLSNEQREVRAPQTANVRATDPSQAIRGAYQAQSSLMSAMGNLAEGGATLIKKVDEMNDAFLRNEAETEYNETTARLNEELATKSLEERVKFQPKYEAEMQKASDIYESKINKVKNFQIREGSKRSINAWNLHNASNYQYQNYQNETDLQQKSTANALLASNRNRLEIVSPEQTLDSLKSIASDPGLGFDHDEQIIRDFYTNRMGEPQAVVDQRVKDYKSKALISMANRYNQVTKDLEPYMGYKTGSALIDWGVSEGYINIDEAISAKRDIQKERLDAAVKRRPEDFIKNGQYNIYHARNIAPDLTEDELIKHINGSSTNKGLSSGAQNAVEQISLQRNRNFFNEVLGDSLGFIPGLVPDKYRKQFVAAGNEEDVNKLQAQRADDFSSVQKIIKYITQADSLLANNRIAVNAANEVVEVDESTGNDEQTLKSKGYTIASATQQDELIGARNKMIAYLENLNHKGKLDDLLEGGFLQKWVPGFQKRKLTNQETNYLQALRPIFDKARPRQIAGWDTQGSVLNPFRTVQMLASIPKVIKRRQEWGPDWELKAKAVPMASQISAALANVNEASAKAQYLTGVSGDEVAEDTRTAPKKPMADVVEEKNGEKTIKRMPDQNAPDITYADAFAYYYADLQADTMGEAFMKQYKNMPDAQAVSAFKHDNMSSDYSLTPKRSLKEKVGYIERIMNPVAGVAHTITGKDIGFAAALPSGESAGSLWSKTKSFFTGVDNNSALGAMAYDIEDGNVAGAPKSFEQLIADGKASNPNQYVQYLSRHENLNDTEKLFSQNKIGELSGMTRVFYVDKPELNEVLQARTLTYTLGYPETATTKNITLEDIAKNSTELQFPSGPTAEYIPVKGNANQVSTAKQNLVFLTPDGYNYLWADEFLQEFDLDPSRAYSMLGLHKAIADKSKVSKKTAVDTAEEKDIKVQEAFNPSIVAINPEDIPSDFKL